MRGPSGRSGIDTQAYLALVRGERRGVLAALARCALWLATGPFRVAVALRGAAFALGLLRARRAPLPVCSVGNLSVGGTGKTPVVIALARRLAARGARVAVLARGYGAPRPGELNDELELVRAEVEGVLAFAGADRLASALAARAAGATVALLDDGFQHRRLARDLDLVLLDATEPFGCPPGWLLPRGLLREPPHALGRADALVLSRADAVGAGELASIEEAARRAGFQGPVLRMRVEPARLDVLHDPAALGEGPSAPRSPAELRGAAVLAVCGIGSPGAFARTLAALGARISQFVELPDHHAYGPEDVERLEELALRRAVERVVVTGKDAVKLAPLLGAGAGRLLWLALAVEARIAPEEEVDRLLDGLLAAGPATPAGPPAPPLRLGGAPAPAAAPPVPDDAPAPTREV